MNFVRKVLSLFTLTHELRFALRRFLPHLEKLVQKYATVASAPLKERYVLILGACKEFPNLYFNTHYGLILCVLKDGERVPVAGIEFEYAFRELVVYRLRSVEGMTDYLDPLRWENLLYEALVSVSDDLRRTTMLKRVRVCEPHRSPYNVWENPDMCRDDLSLREMKQYHGDLEEMHRRLLGYRMHPV